MGLALVVADHQRRAPADARARRDVRPHRVLHLRHRRPGRARVRAEGLDAADGREARQGRLHAGAHAARRLPLGPHRDAARRRALPRGHGRRARHGRPEVVPRPPARGRHRADLRPHLELDHARAVGPAGARHPRLAHERGRVARGLPVRHLRHDRDGPAARARLADLVRGRPRLGAVRPDRAGRAAVGHGRRGGRAARDRAGRHRRVRHHRPAREVLPRVRLRARRRVQRGRGRHGVGQGQGPGLRRQGGARAPSRGGPRDGHVRADRGRPHLGVRREALHARRRADRHARRRARWWTPTAAART